MTASKAVWWLVRAGWVLAASVTAWLVAFSGTDPASTILFGVAIITVAVALLCVGRAGDAAAVRMKILWIGRALGLLGSAVAVSFPAELYQEIQMLVSRGETPAAWFPAAIRYQVAVMPLVTVPALVALRWARLGGVLFLIGGIFNIFESLYRPFGVVFPEATGSGWTGIGAIDLILQPAIVTAVLLLIGGAARTGEPKAGLQRLRRGRGVRALGGGAAMDVARTAYRARARDRT